MQTMPVTSPQLVALRGAVKLVGPHSAFITSCLSKMQTSVSHSTPEAEIVALDTVVRTMALPARDLWEA
eukprot:568927-Alexandrium_andersonii.AAC.1